MLGMQPSHVFSPIIVFLIMSSKYIKLSGLSTYVFADHLLHVLVWIPGLKILLCAESFEVIARRHSATTEETRIQLM